MVGGFDPDFGVFVGIGDAEVGIGLAVHDYGKAEEFFGPCTQSENQDVVISDHAWRIREVGLDSAMAMGEEEFGCSLAEKIGISPAGDRVVDSDFTFGELKGGEGCLGVIKTIVWDAVSDQTLLEGLEIGGLGFAECDNAGFGEDFGLEEVVDFGPEGVALEHDFEIEGVGVVKTDDAGIAVGGALGVDWGVLVVESGLMAPQLAGQCGG